MNSIEIYCLITFLISAVLGCINAFVTYSKACKLGLNPPSIYDSLNGWDFYVFVAKKAKLEPYKKLKKHLIFQNIIIGLLIVTFATFLALATH